MYFRILNLILMLLFTSEIFSQANDFINLNRIPLKSHFDSEDYKGSIQNWSFDQDENGILYAANNEGLLEFDGNKWNKYRVPLATKIRVVKVDSKNRVFIGGQNQIGYFNNTTNGFEFTSLVDNLEASSRSISEIWKIIEVDESIFFNTESKLLVFNGSEIKELETPGVLHASFKYKNKLIVQFHEEGLFEFVNDEFQPISGTNLLPELVGILEKDDDDFYFSRIGIIYKYGKSNVPFKDYSKEFGSINSVIKLNNGGCAIGTQNNGLFILNSNYTIKQHLTKNNGLSDRTVNSVYEDNYNNLWIALNNGIDYLKMSLPFSFINEEVGVEGTGYASHNFKETIYLGTSNGVFTQNHKEEPKNSIKYQFVSGSEGQVYNFSQIDNELILNHHQGAFKINGNSLDKFHDIGSWKFIRTSDPNLIMGGDYQGIRYFKKLNGKWNRIGEIPNLTESSRILEFENDSTLWMTHGYKGAYKLELDRNMQLKNEIQHFGKHSGFPSNILISSYKLKGKLIFTSEQGIYDFDPNTLKFSSNTFFNEMLGKDHVSKLVTAEDNSIYYIQNLELGVLKEESYGKFQKETSVFKHINKFINDDLQSISIINEKNILIGAKEGFIHYNPLKKHHINKDFSVLIRSIEVTKSKDSTSTINPSFTKALEINTNQTIKIEYTSPYFDGFEDLEYSYRLTPLDDNWSKWSPMSEKGYEHLPYGQYTFEVKALNLYGLESEISTFSFEVLTPWYATQTAKLGYFGIGLLTFILIPVIQRKKYKTEKSVITEEKEKELKIKDEEIDQLHTEKLQTELDLKNGQLTSITMQLLKNKEFIQNVQDKIGSTLDEGGSKQELRRLIKTIDQELSDNDSWDQFAYHFDQVHGNYLEKLSRNNIHLSPREIKLAAFLRMNMSSKEISKLLNITTRGVELARYRLRKKLKLKREQNLVEFLIDLDNNSLGN
ncbi:MAG: triple tyrosine motif-containing protein [Psychroserpens sp.]|uniref:triple tyrosine motif-containing protein n=1 Tax=Psychroserpens sp. TaxID=2020870 RepID=UPI0030029670